MSRKRYYAVARGRQTGVFREWFGPGGAEDQIKSYPDARYQGFTTKSEARKWLKEFRESSPQASVLKTELFSPEKSAVSSSDNFEVNQDACKTSAEIKEPAKDKAELKKVTIYTDGGAIRNPGPGGYGTVMMYKGRRRELSEGFRRTTNNRMELLACIEGLEALKYRCRVTIHSDSKYVVKGIMKGWAKRWRANNWMRNHIDPAENADLWNRLLDLCEKHEVKFRWVKGHAGNKHNERCDKLARKAAISPGLSIDKAYEKGKTTLNVSDQGGPYRE